MSKPYKVRVTEEAERNIEKAFQWIDNESPTAAIRWYEEPILAFQSPAPCVRRFLPDASSSAVMGAIGHT